MHPDDGDDMFLETWDLTRATGRNIPEDAIFHNERKSLSTTFNIRKQNMALITANHDVGPVQEHSVISLQIS
jgi:hypothetical protein